MALIALSATSPVGCGVYLRPKREDVKPSPSMDPSLEGKIDYTIEKLENGYVVLITNRFHESGRYYGNIILKTNNTARPEITIPVIGTIG